MAAGDRQVAQRGGAELSIEHAVAQARGDVDRGRERLARERERQGDGWGTEQGREGWPASSARHQRNPLGPPRGCQGQAWAKQLVLLVLLLGRLERDLAGRLHRRAAAAVG